MEKPIFVKYEPAKHITWGKVMLLFAISLAVASALIYYALIWVA